MCYWAGFTQSEQLNEASVKAFKSTCASVLQKDISPDYPWIRHAWDIEGYKLKALYMQSVRAQAQLLSSIANMQNQGSLPKVFSSKEMRRIHLLVNETARYLEKTVPVNVKMSLSKTMK